MINFTYINLNLNIKMNDFPDLLEVGKLSQRWKGRDMREPKT